MPQEPPSGLIYRDSVCHVPQDQLFDELQGRLRVAARSPSAPALLGAFLAAAAFESALADGGLPLALAAANITDRAAHAYLARDGAPLGGAFAGEPAIWRAPRRLRVSRPEGFAYYALWPWTFADAALAALPDPDVLVIGIRTIGVALSAVVKAALERARRRVQRTTVRPGGHPYDRRLVLDLPDRRLALAACRRGAAALIVDEGPGLSGSSFLAVADALCDLGFPRSRIHVLGTRRVDPGTLVAPDAARRWSGFAAHVAAGPQPWHRGDERDLSGGAWRALVLGDAIDRAARPPIWPGSERRKAISRAGVGGAEQVLRKFAGLPPYGEAVLARARALAETGFCPPVAAPLDGDGFITHRFIEGRPMRRGQMTPALATHIGRYIAARADLLPAPPPDPDQRADFVAMVETNVGLELGRGFALPVPLSFPRPVITDARMAPHEWVRDGAGRIWKIDACDHGDDHFFPGPTDVAWDLAGTIVEWRLGKVATARLVAAYRAASGDDPRSRLPAFVLAYAALRARVCLLAARGCGAQDAISWRHAHRSHARALRRALGAPGLQPMQRLQNVRWSTAAHPPSP
jgi:hypothetical protein